MGVKAKIVTFDWPEYLKRSKDGEHQTVLLGWTGDNGDPDNFLHVLLGCDAVGGSNRAQWCHKPFDDLLIQAKRTTDISKRTALYEQAQVVFKKEAPWVHHRPLGGVHAHAQGGRELQDRSLRRSFVLRGRP